MKCLCGSVWERASMSHGMMTSHYTSSYNDITDANNSKRKEKNMSVILKCSMKKKTFYLGRSAL